MKKITKMTTIILLSASLLVGCNSDENEDKVTLEFFSNKPESMHLYESLIEEFEEEHPTINIEFEVPPEPVTVMRTKLTRNKLPDIMSISGDSLYGEMGREGFLYDFTDSDLLTNIQPTYLDMLSRLVGEEVEGNYGIPYATNAVSVIYNKEKLAKYNLDVPTTWDEFIQVLQKVKDNGEIPIYYTLQDSWTAMPSWNAIASNLVPKDFNVMKTNGKTTFQDSYQEVAEKAATLTEYGQRDIIGVGYDDGNRTFANGEGVFYIQGNWVVPELLRINSELELGTFALPATNNPEENKLISGVDATLAISEATEHKEEALQFIQFMLREDIAKRYTEDQKAFSAIKGIVQENEAFEGINHHFENGSITSFVDHYYPNGLGQEGIVQEFYINKDSEQVLKKFDSEWNKVIDR